MFERGGGNREGAAVNVGDEDGKEEEDEDGEQSGREFFRLRGCVQSGEIV